MELHPGWTLKLYQRFLLGFGDVPSWIVNHFLKCPYENLTTKNVVWREKFAVTASWLCPGVMPGRDESV